MASLPKTKDKLQERVKVSRTSCRPRRSRLCSFRFSPLLGLKVERGQEYEGKVSKRRKVVTAYEDMFDDPNADEQELVQGVASAQASLARARVSACASRIRATLGAVWTHLANFHVHADQAEQSQGRAGALPILNLIAVVDGTDAQTGVSILPVLTERRQLLTVCINTSGTDDDEEADVPKVAQPSTGVVPTPYKL